MHNRIAWWLLAAGLLLSTTAHAQTDTPPTEPPLTVPLTVCEAELTKLEATCTEQLTNLEGGCVMSLNEQAEAMTAACDRNVEAAIANERRDSEPRIAGLEAQRSRLQQQVGTWQTVSIVTGAVAVVLLVALVVF